MDRSEYTNAEYDRPNVPPATPPVIDSNADPLDAATLADDDGDSDASGSRPAHLERGLEDTQLFDGGDRIEPGQQPDEVSPGGGDTDQPGSTPDEVTPGQGDFDEPDRSPIESPPQPGATPGETPPPD